MASRQHLACSGEVVTYECAAHVEAKGQLKETLRSLVASDMSSTLARYERGDASLRTAIENRVRQILDHEDAFLSAADCAEIVTEVTDSLLSSEPASG